MDLHNERIKFGPFEADLKTRELWKGGMKLKLGGQPFEILTMLVERPGQLVTRDELKKRIWSEDTFVDFSHGLNAAVNKLREALSDSVEEPKYIETLPRRGYRFVGKIEEPEAALPPIAPAIPAMKKSADWRGSVDDDWQARVPVKRQTLVYIYSGAFLTLILLATVAITRVWVDWRNPDAPAAAERELKLKRAAEKSHSTAPGIWHLDVSHAEDPGSRTLVTSSPEAIAGPQPSPDGKKLAFMSGRNENMDIWVSNVDGSSAQKITSLGRCGTPRWSPDSRWIAFDSDGRHGGSSIYVISADGGAVRAIVDDHWNNMVPSWSRDGEWIYFASNRGDHIQETQVWKVSKDGARVVQLTRNGGFSAYESVDGRTLYYAKTRYPSPEIWEVPAEGGAEARVSSLLQPSTWANWALTEEGILFLSEYSETASTLEYFDFAARGVRPLGRLENASFWLSASADGKSAWYSELTEEQAHLVFVTQGRWSANR